MGFLSLCFCALSKYGEHFIFRVYFTVGWSDHPMLWERITGVKGSGRYPSSWTRNHELGEETTTPTPNRNWPYIILPLYPDDPLTSTSTFDTQTFWCALGPTVRVVGLLGPTVLTTPFRLFTLVRFGLQVVLTKPIRSTAFSINKFS